MEEKTKAIKELIKNSDKTYLGEKAALFSLLSNFSRETQLRIGKKASKRAYELSQKVYGALPEELSTSEAMLTLIYGLLALLGHEIKKLMGEAELESTDTGSMYA